MREFVDYKIKISILIGQVMSLRELAQLYVRIFSDRDPVPTCPQSVSQHRDTSPIKKNFPPRTLGIGLR